MKNLRKRLMSLGLSVVVAAAIFVTTGVQAFAYTETTGTVTTDNVKVRSSAGTTASQVSSLSNGDTVEIVDETKDESGYVWYKIRVNKSEYGYVRSDLVRKAAGTTTTTTSTTSQTNEAAATLPATTATATEERTANITEDSVNVREGAGTAYDSVGKVTKGDTVTVTGEAEGTDGQIWYQVTFGSSGKTGYIRSDLLQVSEAAPAEETAEGAEGGEGAEAAEGAEGGEGGETAEGGDSGDSAVTSEAGDGNFSLVYTPDDQGENTWYLYDNIEGYRVKVKELIDAAKSSDEVNSLVKTNKNYKTILIILAIVVAALVIGLIILALKLRDSLYYEDEEEEEYDRYSQPARRRARDDEEQEDERPRARRTTSDDRTVRPERASDERAAGARNYRNTRREEDAEERPVRTRRSAEASEDRTARRPQEERSARTSSARRSEEEAARPSRRSSYTEAEAAPVQKETPKRKTKNFIGDEDDFEFEFLDLDDDK